MHVILSFFAYHSYRAITSILAMYEVINFYFSRQKKFKPISCVPIKICTIFRKLQLHPSCQPKLGHVLMSTKAGTSVIIAICNYIVVVIETTKHQDTKVQKIVLLNRMIW